MNKIKAAIIEDEIPAGRLLHKMLSGLRPDWDIVVLPGSIEGSVKWFQEHPHPDIIFLDIQLTDGISFAFIEQAQPESMIIFTTAYDEYAIRAFSYKQTFLIIEPQLHCSYLFSAYSNFIFKWRFYLYYYFS